MTRDISRPASGIRRGEGSPQARTARAQKLRKLRNMEPGAAPAPKSFSDAVAKAKGPKAPKDPFHE